MVERQGYYFKIYLPGPRAGGAIPGVAEAPGGGTAAIAGWNSDDTELYWCCYAWPVEAGRTGNRAFFINQEGDVAGTSNIVGSAVRYTAFTSIPAFGAAYQNAPVANTMDQGIGFAAMGFTSNDGNQWTQVGN